MTVDEEMLGQVLRMFYCEASPQVSESRTKQLGTAAQSYHKNTLKNIRSGLNRHFGDLGRNIDIVYGASFKSANRPFGWIYEGTDKSGDF